MARAKRLEVFVDSGAWIALASPRDRFNQIARTAYAEQVSTARLLTTSDVYGETMTRLRYDVGLKGCALFQRQVAALRTADRLEMVWADDDLYASALELMLQHSTLKLSFVDAAAAVTAKARGIKQIFGFDNDFRALGFDLIPG